MIDRRQTLRNAVLTVVQVLVSAGTMFLVYKYLLKTLGADRMGVWSIVMAVSTVARISDLGFAGGMTKFVARYRALREESAIVEVIDTGVVSLTVLVGLIVTVLYPLVQLGLPHLFGETRIGDARLLLPYSLSSFGLLAVGGVYLSALDGLQRADLRNLILIASTLVYAVMIPVCVSRYGFIGLGYAQLAQSAVMLLCGWWTVRRAAGLRHWVPTHWKYERFREMLGYNLNLQVTTFASFLADPLAKLFLGRFGSLAMVGYYEMASKMVAQFRAIVVNVNQVLVPVIAHAQEKDRDSVRTIFEHTYTLLLLVSLTFYGTLAIAVPVLSDLWIGGYNPFFVQVCYILLLAMQVNTLIGPAYFSNLGTGKVGLNTGSQLIIGAVNLCVTPLLGWLAGGVGVVIGYAVAVIAGSAFLMVSFLRAEKFSLGLLLPSVLRGAVLFCLLIVLALSTAGMLLRDASLGQHLALAAAGLAGLVASMWRPTVNLPIVQNVIRRRRAHG